MHRTKIQQYAAHNPHTERTQFSHNMHTHKHSTENNNMQHIEQHIQENTETEHKIQNTEQRTEQTENRTHNLNTGALQTICTYIVLILLFNVYIKKLYNTAIYETYTFWSPYQ